MYAQKAKKPSNTDISTINQISSDIQSETNPNALCGAEMSFKQTSENEFEISLIKYFYCFAKSIDTIENVSIHESLATMFVGQSELRLVSSKDSNLFINANCPNFKKLCVKKSVYIGHIKLMTPMIGGYDVTWGHCCWNESSISNIQGMLESKKQGLGLNLHIPEIEMGVSNSSPSFQSLPILSTCKGQLISINNNATDKDNDSLTYELSSLFNFTTENNVSFKDEPKIEAGKPYNKSFAGGRPPFKKIVYRKGFTYSNPLKSKFLSINTQTGEMQLKPDTIGEFLVGVSVNEFRQNKKLGVYQRIYKVKVTD